MLKLKLPKNRIDYLTAGAERKMKLPVLERGWEYFHRGLVDQVQLKHGYVLEARVRGKETFQVSLDLEQFERSSCTCGFEGYCKHMAALIFFAYSAHARPELLLMQLKQAILTRRRARAAKAAERSAAEPAGAPLPDLAPKEWARLFEQRFHGFSLSNQHSVEQFQQAVWDTLGHAAEGWPAPLRELYRLHLTLYVVRKIEQFHADNQSSYLSFYIENGCKVVAGACWEKLRELTAPDSSIREAADAYPAHWKETIALVGASIGKLRSGPVNGPDIYRFLWLKLFHEAGAHAAELTAKERRRIELALESPSGTPRTRDGLLLSASTFDILDGRDEEAMRRLDGLQVKQFADFYVVLEEFADSDRWDRLLLWLRWLLPLLAKSKQEEFNKGCAYWVEAVKHQPTDEEWLRVMLSLLPRSYYYYTDYLMQTKRYRKWVDLQLATGVTPANLYTAELRVVEGEDPALLLPLFHQAVERAVHEKNRDAYKLAIRHLKKLHSLYKALGHQNRWEDYLARLHQKYARLRAFREELAKGPWTL